MNKVFIEMMIQIENECEQIFLPKSYSKFAITICCTLSYTRLMRLRNTQILTVIFKTIPHATTISPKFAHFVLFCPIKKRSF